MAIQGGRIQKANKKLLNAKGKGKGKGKGNDKPVYIPKPKNLKPSAKEHPAKDDVCHHCKKVGLMISNNVTFRASFIPLIMKYLVKINKKARILELKLRHLKMTVLTSTTPYPSRKIRHICACTSQKTTRKQDSIRCIQGRPMRHIQEIECEYSERYQT
ncbi:hypothetical protein Tco_0302286, partial [Tanacetum coccineum]